MRNRSSLSMFREVPAYAVLPLIVAAVFLSSLIGCGGGSSSSTSSTPTPSPTPTTTPIVSLAGQLAVSSNHDTGFVEAQIYRMGADATSIIRLSNNGANEVPGGWSPSGNDIVFSSNRDNNGGLSNNSDIYLMASDGTNIRRLTKDTSKNSVMPAWSPDGTKIVFSHDKGIAVMNADGSNLTTLTDSTVTNALAPVWSPDGTKIAFVADMPGADNTGTSHSRSIFVTKADGSDRTQIAGGNEYIHQVVWSPDGHWLAFDSTLDTGGATSVRTQLYRIAPDGSGRTRLTNNTATDIGPDWSPDSKLIMFSSNRDHGGGSGGANEFDLYVIDPATTNVVRVTASGLNFFVGPRSWKAN